MDAPPADEDCRPFVNAAGVFAQAGMTVPDVLASDLARGFLLLTDFGTTTYLDVLDEANAPALYADASRALIAIQKASRPGVFPDYDRAVLLRELMLYPDWYVARHKGITLDDAERKTLLDAFELLIANNLAQPQRVRAPRLPLAQPDASRRRSESRRARLPGCAAGTDHLRPRVADARRVHRLDRRA